MSKELEIFQTSELPTIFAMFQKDRENRIIMIKV